VETATRLLVMQEAGEAAHPFGTVRLLAMAMERLTVVTVAGRHAPVAVPPFDMPPRTAVLFPSTGATPVDQLDDGARPETLIVLDASWRHARRMLHQHPWLNALPHVRLTDTPPSRYRIRKPPSAEALSTLEAVVAALEHLEPDNGDLQLLLDAFDGMVARQLAVESGEGHVRGERVRGPRG